MFSHSRPLFTSQISAFLCLPSKYQHFFRGVFRTLPIFCQWLTQKSCLTTKAPLQNTLSRSQVITMQLQSQMLAADKCRSSVVLHLPRFARATARRSQSRLSHRELSWVWQEFLQFTPSTRNTISVEPATTCSNGNRLQVHTARPSTN